MLKKNKMLEKKFAFKLSGVVFIMPINMKMSTIVGILTFMSRMNLTSFMLISTEHEI